MAPVVAAEHRIGVERTVVVAPVVAAAFAFVSHGLQGNFGDYPILGEHNGRDSDKSQSESFPALQLFLQGVVHNLNTFLIDHVFPRLRLEFVKHLTAILFFQKY